METSGPHDQDPRREMIDALTESIMNEDYAFFDSITQNQAQLNVTELAEYMDVKRRGTEDPVEANRWEAGLRRYLQQLEGKEFSEDELLTINAIVQNLEFDAITGNEQVAEETEYTEQSDDDDWEDATFAIRLEQADIDEVRSSVWFQSAETNARNGFFERAIEKLDKIQGERHAKARQVIDWYVFLGAECNAKNGFFERALEKIKDFGYDEVSRANMRSAIDKYVYASAKTNIESGFYDRGEAKIRDYASTPGRRNAMLRRIGLL